MTRAGEASGRPPLPRGRLLIATTNPGKMREIAGMLERLPLDLVSLEDLPVILEPEETGSTFAENARLKALYYHEATGLPSVADDSGLVIAALDGAPGIHSARWGGPNKDFGLAMARVNEELEAAGALDRRANFTCALALAAPDGTAQSFEGKIFGTLIWPPRGTRGFGYDPIFVPDGYAETFGEMEPALKNALSHRMRAFEQLMAETYAADE